MSDPRSRWPNTPEGDLARVRAWNRGDPDALAAAALDTADAARASDARKVTAVDDLVTWLRAQLGDDERMALAASPGPWKPNAEHDEVLAVDDITVADGFALSGNQLRATVGHIARWDPARVLAEVEAKRRIVDEWASEYYEHRAALGRAVRLLALPYAEHPGYREEWRP